MTRSEIVDNILLLGYGGRKSDDQLIHENQLVIWINYYRSKFIKEYVIKYGTIDEQFVQDLGCLELICVDEADCCNFGVGRNYKKLKQTLPMLLQMKTFNPLQYLGLVDGQTRIPITDGAYFSYAKYAKWTGKNRKALRIGNQIYFQLPPNDLLEVVKIRAILDDPSSLNTLQGNGCACYDPDTDQYPATADTIQLITQAILTIELPTIFKDRPFNDTDNNAMDSQTGKVPQQ